MLFLGSDANSHHLFKINLKNSVRAIADGSGARRAFLNPQDNAAKDLASLEFSRYFERTGLEKTETFLNGLSGR